VSAGHGMAGAGGELWDGAQRGSPGAAQDHEELNPWVLNISTDGESTATPGSPCQCLTNLTAEKGIFFCSDTILYFLHLCPLPHWRTPLKRARFPLCCTLPCRCLPMSLGTPRGAPAFPPGRTAPALPASPHMRDAPAPHQCQSQEDELPGSHVLPSR